MSRVIYTIINILVVFSVAQGACALLIWVERRIAAFVQDRYGPNRVGPEGILQSVADGLKFLFKEDVIPAHVDRKLFLLAPCVSLITAFLAFSVVPFGPSEPEPAMPMVLARPLPEGATAAEIGAHDRAAAKYEQELADYRGTYQAVIAPGVDIGILFVFALGSLAVYGIILGGWSANNKYSLLGGLRSSAQIISYEIPLGLSVLGVLLMARSLNLERIIWQQAGGDGGWPVWYICYQPLAFLLFLISGFAETNRLPFDLPEAEQELIGGFHTEYSAMKFAMFFLGEYANVITTSFLMVILFFGGWHFWFIAYATMPPWLGFFTMFIVILVKVTLAILFIMLVRWTLPRFRFDQLMGLAWKVLIPLALFNLVAVMVVLEIKRVTHIGWLDWVLLPISLIAIVAAGLITARPPSSSPLPSGGEGRRYVKEVLIMPIAESQVHWVKPPELSLAERLYLPAIAQGLGTTIKHLFGPKVTQQFPEQRPTMPPNYRGVHRLNRDEQGRVKCVACYMCSTACPARCIDIVAAPSPWPDREKYPEVFVVDELRCIYCGMCEQACPCDAIELTSLYDLTGLSREEMMFDKEKLLSVFDQTVAAGTDPIRTHSGKLSVASEPKL